MSLAGRLPFHERDLASQRLRRLPLWEAAKELLEGGAAVLQLRLEQTPDREALSLANDLLMQLVKEKSGVYQSLDYFSKD